ncbi:hypothetical protein LTR78_007499 [Recurvomyces mirabilis]|uniref:Secreted protein n=1 Tax=Recurvomyces mirabilis TaxID=574656 RepID=A0AAE0TRY8_9PEZI|nr:hypothetical protein LTR78_007499 [Recurvomyces mirabilis]KAK5159991.1 hypothetical protein LTS14_002097 [Recurvomyces mirabilis]
MLQTIKVLGILIFLNDVVTCASDIRELVHQQRLQQADLVVGIDWGTVKAENEDPKDSLIRLYDRWMLRGINGELPCPFEQNAGYSPQTDNDGASMATCASDLRVSLGARGGGSNGALRELGRLICQDGYMRSHCPGASECEYVCRDIWNMRQGRGRIVLAPQARTTYNVEGWTPIHRLAPARRRDAAGVEALELIVSNEVEAPKNVVCIATRTEQGGLFHAWIEQNQRKKLSPVIDYEASRSSRQYRGIQFYQNGRKTHICASIAVVS